MNNTAMSSFSRKTINALKKRGIAIIGATWLPGHDGSYSNGETGYQLDDNGTHRVRTFLEVLSMAEGKA